MRIFLAPMEGVVDHHLRKIYAGMGGIDCFVTEFIRVNDTELPDKVFRRFCPELEQPLPLPVRIQLLGSNPEMLALNAHKAAALGAPAVDLNFGCPAKTVNKSRGGACLLEETNLLFDIVNAVRKAVPDEIPITAKIRLGYRQRSRYVENALAIVAAGANELFVHGRSKEDGYAPPAYWDCIGEIRQALSIPVIANGEIWNLEDFISCRAQSGCEDVMLGRGLLATPDLARQIRAHTEGRDLQPLHWAQCLPILRTFHLNTVDHYPLQYCGNRLKQWLMYLKRQYTQANDLFEQVKKLRDPKALLRALEQHEAALTDCAFSTSAL